MFIVLTYFWLRWVVLNIWLSFTIHYFIFHFKCCSILHFAVCQLLCWAFMLCNRCNVMHQIACTFIKSYPGVTPLDHLLVCCYPEPGPLPSKMLAARLQQGTGCIYPIPTRPELESPILYMRWTIIPANSVEHLCVRYIGRVGNGNMRTGLDHATARHRNAQHGTA